MNLLPVAVLVFIVIIVIVACSIQEDRKNRPIEPPINAPIRHDKLLFGYYGDCNGFIPCYAAISGHTNLLMIPSYGPMASQAEIDAANDRIVQNIKAATSAGPAKKVIVFVNHLMYTQIPNKQVYVGDALAATRLRELFFKFRLEGVSDKVHGFYPLDEPDLNVEDLGGVPAQFNLLRQVMDEYPEYKSAVIAIFYNSGSQFPGLAQVDWVGVDDYNAGVSVLYNQYPALKKVMGPNQRLMVIPGGSDPWKEDPTSFYNYALNDPSVVAIVAFAYFNMSDGTPGISTNGLASIYAGLGTKIVNTP